MEPFARISRFLKQHGSVPGIQIAHAGRKASAHKPREGDNHIDSDKGDWDTIARSAIPFGGTLPKIPKEMSVPDIQRIQEAFVNAAKRARASAERDGYILGVPRLDGALASSHSDFWDDR